MIDINIKGAACHDAYTTMIVRFQDNLELLVPPRIDLLTPYVLLEQERWFESETEFVNAWIKPGMRVLDVGANHGVYTVMFAELVGPDGCVWAFEPCRQTFGYLCRSITHNGLSNVHAVNAALGANFGEVRLTNEANCEMNQITVERRSDTEAVDLTTLDFCAEKFNFGDIDFIKLDAEGYETHVVGGGLRLLDQSSPLIMFEYKHGGCVNSELVDALGRYGYELYRFVPGINCLVPYPSDERGDPLLLNLFACKQDRAQQLRQDGFLVSAAGAPVTKLAHDAFIIARGVGANASRADLSSSRADGQLSHILRRATLDADNTYLRAACLLVIAENVELAPLLRLQAAQTALALCAEDVNDSVWFEALRSRLLVFLGERSAAATVTARLLPRLRLRRSVPPKAILAAHPRYDALDQDGDRWAWFAASVHECFERSRAFSSYMLGRACIENVEAIHRLGFLPVDLERRRQLIHRCFIPGPAPSVPECLLRDRPDNKNPHFWQFQQKRDRYTFVADRSMSWQRVVGGAER